MNEGIGTGPANAPDTSTTASRLRRGDHRNRLRNRLVEPSSRRLPQRARRCPVDEDWYKRAVFYEVLVRAFADSNRDGFGDLRGLTDKLDYLAWLGVDCLWLPPFYDSPLRDGGYDIRDYRKVLGEFGTVEDFVEFARPGARARHPRDHRPRHEPHVRPAPVVPGVPP